MYGIVLYLLFSLLVMKIPFIKFLTSVLTEPHQKRCLESFEPDSGLGVPCPH